MYLTSPTSIMRTANTTSPAAKRARKRLLMSHPRKEERQYTRPSCTSAVIQITSLGHCGYQLAASPIRQAKGSGGGKLSDEPYPSRAMRPRDAVQIAREGKAHYWPAVAGTSGSILKG